MDETSRFKGELWRMRLIVMSFRARFLMFVITWSYLSLATTNLLLFFGFCSDFGSDDFSTVVTSRRPPNLIQ